MSIDDNYMPIVSFDNTIYFTWTFQNYFQILIRLGFHKNSIQIFTENGVKIWEREMGKGGEFSGCN